MPVADRSVPNQLLELSQVTRRFGGRIAVERVSLSVRPGEIHLLVGPNGSGKSTLARLAVGLLKPHEGMVRIRGHDPRHDPAVRSLLGYCGHETQLYYDLSPRDNLRFIARLYGLGSGAEAVIDSTLGRFDIGPERNSPIRRLSRGLSQRVTLARSLLHEPALLVWDEPLTGLDRRTVEQVLAVMGEARDRGAGVLVISHDLPDLWRLDAHVHVLEQGRLATTTSTATPLADFLAGIATPSAECHVPRAEH